MHTPSGNIIIHAFSSCMACLITYINVLTLEEYFEIWSCGIMNPVLKDGKKDHRDPNTYRGITITSAAYKLYCSIINNRLYNWFELNNGLYKIR